MKTENNNSLSNLASFYDDTKYEWHVAKHRKPSPGELDLLNSLPIEKSSIEAIVADWNLRPKK